MAKLRLKRRRVEFAMGVLGTVPLVEREEGRALFEVLEACAPELLPQQYGMEEPLGFSWQDGGVERMLGRCWNETSSTFLWASRRGAVNGSVHRRWADFVELSEVTVSVRDDVLPPTALVSVFEALCLQQAGEYALLHPSSKHDAEVGSEAGYMDGPRGHLAVFAVHVEKYVPDLFWCTVLGPTYVREVFGTEAVDRVIAESGIFEARLLDDGALFLRFTEEPLEVIEDRASFEAARARIKEMLGADAFFSLASGPDGDYRTPWESSTAPRAVARAPAKIVEGMWLVEPDGAGWTVKRHDGDFSVIRRDGDGLEMTIQGLGQLVALGAFAIRGGSTAGG